MDKGKLLNRFCRPLFYLLTKNRVTALLEPMSFQGIGVLSGEGISGVFGRLAARLRPPPPDDEIGLFLDVYMTDILPHGPAILAGLLPWPGAGDKTSRLDP